MESTRSSTPGRGFPPIPLLLGMLYCLFFKAWKAIDSLTCVPNFLFSRVYLKLWFNFEDGPSLDLSCRMSSVFIIILIIHIIKTASFNKTILMVELEGKSLLSRWYLLAGNFPSSSYFHKIFGMHLQKGLVYLYTKKFLPLLLHFWNYNLSPNGKVIPYQRSSTPPNTAREGWMVQSIEDYSL